MTDASPAEHDSLLGARIDGRYTVLRELGRGGMGVVYEGVHDDLGRPVAIKVLNLAWASDPTAVARFLREARTASSFSHPNIVDVTDLGRLPDGRPYLIMPKITGTDLAAMLTENGAQPAKRVAQLLVGVAAALDVIHAKGFVHRDIKPENLMYVVREDGSETVMLLDFGIAAAVMSNEPRLTGQGAIFGTPQFMPPEVCNGGMPDARGDVYALATVAFELITGVLPFGDDNMMRVLTAKLTSDPPTLSQASGVPFPPELEAVIARGLARDPAERYGTASEFIGSLKASTEHAPVSWKSGVLRPSFRSAAHPVGSHPSTPYSSHPPAGLPNAVTQRTPGKPIPRPAMSSQPPRGTSEPPRRTPPHRGTPQEGHWSQRAIDAGEHERDEWRGRPSARDDYRSPSSRDDYAHDDYRSPSARDDYAEDEYRSPSSRADYLASSARDDYARANVRNDYARGTTDDGHWARRAGGHDPWGRPPSALGAGLRESERARRMDSERPSGGKRVAALLGIAALLLGFVWYRHNRGLGFEGRDAILPPSAATRPPAAQQLAAPGASAAAEAPPAAAQPSALANPNTAVAEPPRAEGTGPSPGVMPGTEGALAAPAEPGLQPGAQPAHEGSLPPVAAAVPGAQDPQGTGTAVGPAAPNVGTPSVHAALPVPAAKLGMPATHPGARPQAPASPAKPSGVSADAPPAPRAEPPAPEPYMSAEPPEAASPVLVVEEQAPPPAAEEELPDLPVRSPQSQAAQLAKDASTALLAGEVGHAIELLREATRLDPDQSLAWRTMGLAFERSGDTQAALAAYRQYIRLAPHGPHSDMVRERMRVLDQQ
jgi:serine/threonine protein kinase